MDIATLKLKNNYHYGFDKAVNKMKSHPDDNIAMKLNDHVVKKEDLFTAKFKYSEITSTQWQLMVPDTDLIAKIEEGKRLSIEEAQKNLDALTEQGRRLERANCMDSDSCPYMKRYTDENNNMTCPDHCTVRQQLNKMRENAQNLLRFIHPDWNEDKIRYWTPIW